VSTSESRTATAVTAIDTSANRVIATIPNGQAAQALVYVPQGSARSSGGNENLQPLGPAGRAVHLALAMPGSSVITTVSLFDQGLTQVLQAAVAGLEPAKPHVLALAPRQDGSGTIEQLAQFMTNPAGSAVVNAVGAIRQMVAPDAPSQAERRYLAIFSVDDGKPGLQVQLQRSEMSTTGGR
jgi:hypothetical protein